MNDQYQLVVEAQTLMRKLKEKMWQASFNRNQEYYLLERVYQSALKRYERRYNNLFPEDVT